MEEAYLPHIHGDNAARYLSLIYDPSISYRTFVGDPPDNGSHQRGYLVENRGRP
jgi:hypothetical protein